MDTKAILDAVKLILRLAILWAPFLLSVIAELEGQGIFAAISLIVTGLDKYIHASKDIKATGIIPF